MRSLYFDRTYRESILSGAKTQTIRCWARPMVREGEEVKTNIGAVLRILSREEIDLADLTDEDARVDGFDSADELRARLAARYADKPCPYYKVRFLLVSGPPQPDQSAFAL